MSLLIVHSDRLAVRKNAASGCAKIEVVHKSDFARSNRIRNEKRVLQLIHPRFAGNPEVL